MAEAEFEVIGSALDKGSDEGEFVVYRQMGGAALYICRGDVVPLPTDPHIDTRDRSGSGFARTIDSEPVLERGRYAHYKGGFYEVGGLALRTDSTRDNDWWVIYTACGNTELYARPLEDFTGVLSIVDRSEPVQRFRKIENTAHE